MKRTSPVRPSPWLLALLLAACAGGPEDVSDVERDPRFREARADLAQRYPASAASKLQELVPRYGDDPILLRWLGRARILAGDGSGGREALRRSLEKRPGDVQARLWLAQSAREDEQFEDALEAYGEAYALDAANDEALRAMIELNLAMGREREALTRLTAATRRMPEDADLRDMALRAALTIGEFERAVKEGEALLRLRRTPESLDLVAQAITKLDPRRATRDELDRAEIHLREAMRLAPQEERHPYHLGVVLEAKGTPQSQQDAEAAYRRALDIHPEFVPALENLAGLYSTGILRDPDKAIELLEKAIPLQTDDDRREGLLQRLETLRAEKDGGE